MVKDSVGTFITKVIVLFLSVLVSILLNKSLGPAGRGQLAVEVLIPQILWVLGSLGLDYSNIFYAGKNKERIPTIATNSVWLGLGLGFVCIAMVMLVWGIISLFDPTINKFLLDVPKYYFVVMLLTVPPYLVAYFLDSAIYGMNKIHVRNIKEIVTNVLLLILTVIVVTDPSKEAPFVHRSFGFGLNMGIYGASITQLFYALFMMVYSLILIRRFTKWEFKGLDWDFFVKGIKHVGFYAYGATAATFLFHRIGIFIITYFIGSRHILTKTDLGLFANATYITEKLMFIPGAIAYALLPKITAQDPEEAKSITAKASRHTFLLTSVVLGALCIFISPILVILYGKEFEGAKYPFWMLAPGVLLLSVGRIYSTHLFGIGKAFYAFYYSIITLILNIILNIILIPIWGINGSAIATSIAYGFQSVLMYHAFWRETKIPMSELIVLRRSDLEVYARGINELRKYLSRRK